MATLVRTTTSAAAVVVAAEALEAVVEPEVAALLLLPAREAVDVARLLLGLEAERRPVEGEVALPLRGVRSSTRTTILTRTTTT